VIEYGAARPEDIPAIAALFQSAFPEALDAVFGRHPIPAQAVEDVWGAIYRYEPTGFIAARDGERLAGIEIAVSDLARLHRHLLFGGPLMRRMLCWLTGGYKGLGFHWLARVVRLAWDYRKVEKPASTQSPSFAQILTIIVDKNYQCRGIGKALTEKTLSYLEDSKAVKTVRLEVDAAKIHAIHLYESAGFREMARMPTPRGPALIMIRMLT
jgi:ribosomal protein S18 acetylase RimI-like enzyme